LDTTQVDAKGGKFLWPDGKRLGIEHTVRRIYKAHPELGRQLIEDKVISWLEMGTLLKTSPSSNRMTWNSSSIAGSRTITAARGGERLPENSVLLSSFVHNI